MAISTLLKPVGELLAEGVIFRWLANIWTALKGGMTHPVVQDWAKSKLTLKGLDDDSIFAYILSVSSLLGKKLQLIRVLNQLEAIDKTNGTRYVRNFRLIVALDATGRGKILVKKKDADGKTISVEPIADPNYHRPGKGILENLAEECNSDAEMIQFIIATGAMQDAPFGTLDELKNWAIKTAIPNVIKFIDGTASAAGDGISWVTTYVTKQYAEREKSIKKWEGMKTGDKLLPKNLWNRFMDQF